MPDRVSSRDEGRSRVGITTETLGARWSRSSSWARHRGRASDRIPSAPRRPTGSSPSASRCRSISSPRASCSRLASRSGSSPSAGTSVRTEPSGEPWSRTRQRAAPLSASSRGSGSPSSTSMTRNGAKSAGCTSTRRPPALNPGAARRGRGSRSGIRFHCSAARRGSPASGARPGGRLATPAGCRAPPRGAGRPRRNGARS